MRYIGEGSTLTRDESEEQVSTFVRHWEVKGFGLWAVEEKASGAFVGFVGLAHQDEWTGGEHMTEVGWQLDRACWGKGLATEGAVACVTGSRNSGLVSTNSNLLTPRFKVTSTANVFKSIFHDLMAESPVA